MLSIIKSSQNKLITGVLTIFIYCAVYAFFFPRIGQHIGPIAAIPIFVWAYLYGIKGGLLAGLLVIPIDLLIKFLFPHPQLGMGLNSEMLHGYVLGYLMGILLGIMLGWIRDTKLALDAKEEQISLIVNNLPVLVSFVNPEEKYSFNNAVYEKWFNIKPEQLKGLHVSEVVGQEIYKDISPYFKKAFSGEAVEFDRKGKSPDGREIYTYNRMIPQFSREGRVEGVLCMVMDITHRVELEHKQKEIESLQNLLPICAWCKKIRNDQNYWESVEKYLTTETGRSLTHGICPDCREKYFKKTIPGQVQDKSSEQ